MDLYLASLLLGVVGLGAMALIGMDGAGHHVQHGHQGHFGQLRGRGGGKAQRGQTSSFLLSLMSPRLLFSLALGFGLAGSLAKPFLGGSLRLVVALVGAALFERAFVSPLWNLAMRFASRPAATLESAITDEATAVTAFDANGQGIVSVEVDGQIVQVLATLTPADRALGARVRSGQRVRIEEVSGAEGRCTVSII